jgi:hypothetical protein
MYAILAIIADGGRVIIVIYREAVEIIFFPLIFNLILNHLKATLLNPFRRRRGARRWGMLVQQNHGAGGENGTIMVVVFVSCVLQVFC